jgi:hypothetical protein
VTAQIEVSNGPAEGVIVAQGGAFGGWTLYAKDGKPAYCYNLFGLQLFKIAGEEAITDGTHQVRMEFAYDGGGLGKGGNVTQSNDTSSSAGAGKYAERSASSGPPWETVRQRWVPVEMWLWLLEAIDEAEGEPGLAAPGPAAAQRRCAATGTAAGRTRSKAAGSVEMWKSR